MKLHWRYHDINWNARAVPVERDNFDWIDRAYRDNPEEYPFVQFQLSKALGRVIGFWDETGIFNVVVLDPMHNMQPSDYSDYKLRETPIALGEFHAVMQVFEAKIQACAAENCGCRGIYAEVQAAVTSSLPFATMLVPMEDALFERAAKCVASGLADAISDLIQIGIDAVEKDMAPSTGASKA